MGYVENQNLFPRKRPRKSDQLMKKLGVVPSYVSSTYSDLMSHVDTDRVNNVISSIAVGIAKFLEGLAEEVFTITRMAYGKEAVHA